MTQLDNTAALVTGGASGLGAATAKALAEQGAAVFALGLPASIDQASPSRSSGIQATATSVTAN
ncbi:SDR family NAD(P)-dependent oxidoreductase [Streptomyces sp. NPDC048254]|uniref:SDR family NAD(P)-dependent oxidoreductase n=1 Tax=Streptomyces sp. NPDC048254 TaxID=3365525 RepID=UPI00371AE171